MLRKIVLVLLAVFVVVAVAAFAAGPLAFRAAGVVTCGAERNTCAIIEVGDNVVIANNVRAYQFGRDGGWIRFMGTDGNEKTMRIRFETHDAALVVP